MNFCACFWIICNYIKGSAQECPADQLMPNPFCPQNVFRRLRLPHAVCAPAVRTGLRAASRAAGVRGGVVELPSGQRVMPASSL